MLLLFEVDCSTYMQKHHQPMFQQLKGGEHFASYYLVSSFQNKK